MSDYGSLRRRQRDGSWQWLLIGLVLGMGFAMVACVGGYALGAITFPALEGDASTPHVVAEPNTTEIAAQIIASQQAGTATQLAGEATIVAETLAAEDRTPDEVVGGTTPSPSPLPNGAMDDASTPGTPGQTPVSATTTGQGGAGLEDGTPVVGTPPVGAPSPTVGFTNQPQIPPELEAIQTRLVTITGGTYMMGTTPEEASQAVDECALYNTTCPIEWVQDSTPAHQTTVDSFQIEEYEVTTAQYVAFLNWMGPNSHKAGCQGQPCAMTTTDEETSTIDFDGTTYSVNNAAFYSDHPVTWVTWWGADEYCRTLNRRLPTEAEWERAARGPENSIYPWGNTFDVALANSSRPAAEGTESVSSYPAGLSAFGVYNMAGNVSEWVSDWYQSNYYSLQLANPEPNPQGPIGGTEKVARGGSWDTVPLLLRAVHRQNVDPLQPTAAIGFRCAADSAVTVAPAPVIGNQAGTGTPAQGGAPTLAPQPTTPPTIGPTATLAPG